MTSIKSFVWGGYISSYLDEINNAAIPTNYNLSLVTLSFSKYLSIKLTV